MVKVTQRDRGAKAMLRALGKKQPAVRVGVFGDAAAQKHSDGATMGDLATAHEFQIPGGQGRRWLRTTLEENAELTRTAMRRAAEAVLKGMDPAQALEQFGAGLAGLAQARIAAGLSPGLDPAYLERKLAKYPGATTPLIASGAFRGSITHAVDGLPEQRSAGGGGKRKASGSKRK
jgi:hypothetical protein